VNLGTNRIAGLSDILRIDKKTSNFEASLWFSTLSLRIVEKFFYMRNNMERRFCSILSNIIGFQMNIAGFFKSEPSMNITSVRESCD
jgi:hypothetical protein